LPHARKVLAEFGRAYGRLPEDLGDLSREQGQFLDQAVAELAEDGKVISCVWPCWPTCCAARTGARHAEATWRGNGRGRGVSGRELQRRKRPGCPPPRSGSARAVLKSLLREEGSEIKGALRSYDELLAASECRNPQDFTTL